MMSCFGSRKTLRQTPRLMENPVSPEPAVSAENANWRTVAIIKHKQISQERWARLFCGGFLLDLGMYFFVFFIYLYCM